MPYDVISRRSCRVIRAALGKRLTLVLLLTFAFGCQQRVERNNTIEFSYRIWVPVCITGAALILIRYGIMNFWDRKNNGWNFRFKDGFFFLSLGVVIIAIASTQTFREKVIVTGESFSFLEDELWMPKRREVHYAELKNVEFTFSTINRSDNKEYKIILTFKSGRHEFLKMSNVFQTALPEILANMRSHDVTVYSLENAPR